MNNETVDRFQRQLAQWHRRMDDLGYPRHREITQENPWPAPDSPHTAPAPVTSTDPAVAVAAPARRPTPPISPPTGPDAASRGMNNWYSPTSTYRNQSPREMTA